MDAKITTGTVINYDGAVYARDRRQYVVTGVHSDGTLALGFTSRSTLFISVDASKVSKVAAEQAIPSYRHLFAEAVA